VGFGSKVLGNKRYTSITERGNSTQAGVPIEWPLYHLARGLGKGSSAASKYCNINASSYFPKVDPSVVVSLADGCAGTLALLMHVFLNSMGIYNSLLDDLVHSVAEPCEYKPSGLVGCNLSQRIPNLRRMVTGSSDITQPVTQTKIVNLVKDLGEVKEILLTMDTESRETQDWELLLSSTVSIIKRFRLPTVSIIKLILPEELMNEGRESGLTRYILDMSCPTETARQIRKDSWGFEVHTATFAHPVDQIRFLDVDSAKDEEYDKSILVTVSEQIMEGGSNVGWVGQEVHVYHILVHTRKKRQLNQRLRQCPVSLYSEQLFE